MNADDPTGARWSRRQLLTCASAGVSSALLATMVGSSAAHAADDPPQTAERPPSEPDLVLQFPSDADLYATQPHLRDKRFRAWSLGHGLALAELHAPFRYRDHDPAWGHDSTIPVAQHRWLLDAARDIIIQVNKRAAGSHVLQFLRTADVITSQFVSSPARSRLCWVQFDGPVALTRSEIKVVIFYPPWRERYPEFLQRFSFRGADGVGTHSMVSVNPWYGRTSIDSRDGHITRHTPVDVLEHELIHSAHFLAGALSTMNVTSTRTQFRYEDVLGASRKVAPAPVGFVPTEVSVSETAAVGTVSELLRVKAATTGEGKIFSPETGLKADLSNNPWLDRACREARGEYYRLTAGERRSLDAREALARINPTENMSRLALGRPLLSTCDPALVVRNGRSTAWGERWSLRRGSAWTHVTDAEQSWNLHLRFVGEYGGPVGSPGPVGPVGPRSVDRPPSLSPHGDTC